MCVCVCRSLCFSGNVLIYRRWQLWATNDNKHSPRAPTPIKCSCLLENCLPEIFPLLQFLFLSPFLPCPYNMHWHLFESVVTAASDVHEKWFFALENASPCPLIALSPESVKRKTENSSFCYKLKCCQHLHATCGIFGQKFTLKFIIYFYYKEYFSWASRRKQRKQRKIGWR